MNLPTHSLLFNQSDIRNFGSCMDPKVQLPARPLSFLSVFFCSFGILYFPHIFIVVLHCVRKVSSTAELGLGDNSVEVCQKEEQSEAPGRRQRRIKEKGREEPGVPAAKEGVLRRLRSASSGTGPVSQGHHARRSPSARGHVGSPR